MKLIDFRGVMSQVVAETPDYVYDTTGNRSCVYLKSEPDGRRCLIGETLSRMGIADETLDRSQEATELMSELSVDPKLILYAAVAQRFQDHGYTWQQAFDMAEFVGGFASLFPSNMEKPKHGVQA